MGGAFKAARRTMCWTKTSTPSMDDAGRCLRLTSLLCLDTSVQVFCFKSRCLCLCLCLGTSVLNFVVVPLSIPPPVYVRCRSFVTFSSVKMSLPLLCLGSSICQCRYPILFLSLGVSVSHSFSVTSDSWLNMHTEMCLASTLSLWSLALTSSI